MNTGQDRLRHVVRGQQRLRENIAESRRLIDEAQSRVQSSRTLTMSNGPVADKGAGQAAP